jgi:molybdopterin-binding protein
MVVSLQWTPACCTVAARQQAGGGGTALPHPAGALILARTQCGPMLARICSVPRLTHRRTAMKISARNQFKGKILEVKKGATTAHIRVEIAPGQVITSSITNEAVDELGLKVGGTAIAVIKASNVMIAVE